MPSCCSVWLSLFQKSFWIKKQNSCLIFTAIDSSRQKQPYDVILDHPGRVKHARQFIHDSNWIDKGGKPCCGESILEGRWSEFSEVPWNYVIPLQGRGRTHHDAFRLIPPPPFCPRVLKELRRAHTSNESPGTERTEKTLYLSLRPGPFSRGCCLVQRWRCARKPRSSHTHRPLVCPPLKVKGQNATPARTPPVSAAQFDSNFTAPVIVAGS